MSIVMKIGERTPNMICLQCDNQEFVHKPVAVIEQVLRGETFKVETPAMACAKCGWITVTAEQVNELRRSTADAYKKAHGLLTSDDIKTYRKTFDMNQPEFAELVNVGVASVKRWETWLVQDKSSDDLIRLKVQQELKRRAEQEEQKRLAAKAAADIYIQPQQQDMTPTLAPKVSTKTINTSFNRRMSVQTFQQAPKWLVQACSVAFADTGPPLEEFAEESAFSLSAPLANRTLKKQMLIHLN